MAGVAVMAYPLEDRVNFLSIGVIICHDNGATSTKPKPSLFAGLDRGGLCRYKFMLIKGKAYVVGCRQPLSS
jgi:hypothetical protein